MRSLLRDRSAFVGLVIIGIYVLGAAAAPWLTTADPNAIDPIGRFAGPSASHPFGTDHLGRDMFTRILYGARVSMSVALAVTAGTTLIGLLMGIIAGYAGGLTDTLISRTIDILQALPGLVLALALVGVLGPSLRNLTLALIAVGWTGDARLVRSITLGTRETAFVESARALGASSTRIVRSHIVPNVLGPAVVLATLTMGGALLAVSGLSFLGLGASPPSPEWGAMLNEARTHLAHSPTQLIYPGAAISIFVLAFNLIGDGLRDALDPQLASKGTW